MKRCWGLSSHWYNLIYILGCMCAIECLAQAKGRMFPVRIPRWNECFVKSRAMNVEVTDDISSTCGTVLCSTQALLLMTGKSTLGSTEHSVHAQCMCCALHRKNPHFLGASVSNSATYPPAQQGYSFEDLTVETPI